MRFSARICGRISHLSATFPHTFVNFAVRETTNGKLTASNAQSLSAIMKTRSQHMQNKLWIADDVALPEITWIGEEAVQPL